jgi:hypothetical protein
MKFKFLGDPATPIAGKPYHFQLHGVEVEADDYESALKIALAQWPADGKPWTGFSMERIELDEEDQ